MSTPLVSVIVATYRRKESLKHALSSLTQQTYTNTEILLVDDNDNQTWNQTVREIAESVLADFPKYRLKIIENHPNLGSARARNAGIIAASGDYITFLDDDDVYLPEKIAQQIVAMMEVNADYCITDLDLYNENGKLIDQRVRSYIRSESPEDLLKYHLMHHMTGTDTMMFRTEYLKKIGGFPPIDVGDEFYLMVEAIRGDGRFHYLPGCDVTAYVHTKGGLSSGEGKIRGENELYRYKKTFFDCLDGKSRRYIRMRHHAVLAFAEIKRKRILAFLYHGLKAFFSAPIACVNMLIKR